MPSFSLYCTPAASRPRPDTLGLRPVATSKASTMMVSCTSRRRLALQGHFQEQLVEAILSRFPFMFQGDAWPGHMGSGQDTACLTCISHKLHEDNCCWPQGVGACQLACAVYICGSCLTLLGSCNTWDFSMYRCKCYAATHFAAGEFCGWPQ